MCKNIKTVDLVILLCACLCEWAYAGPKGNTVKISELNIRDPFIVADTITGLYYMYKTSSVSSWAESPLGGVCVYKSADLENWEGPYQVFTVPQDNWITGTVWAPEVHAYKGKYYLFATLNSTISWKKEVKNWPRYNFRGVQIFYSDSLEGPFLPFDLVPHTKMDRMALDGTLYVQDDVPYMVYCHEWVQLIDGGMELVELAQDLSAPVGEPLTLFYASAAPWSTGNYQSDELPLSYVTDGCFLYRTKTGKLLMIWSSFLNSKYAIGIAESTTGKIYGPWRQQETPLFSEHGGHGMLFKTFDGRLCLVLHSPNDPSGAERAHIFELEDTGDSLVVKGEITAK